MSIPKIIHYCWFGKNPLPPSVKKCIASWEKKCPDYEIIRWDETNFDIRENEYMSQAYDAGKWAFVSDFARLKIVYENGGIFYCPNCGTRYAFTEDSSGERVIWICKLRRGV